MPGLIDHIKKFVPLNDEGSDTLLKYTSAVSVGKKETLLKEGQVCRQMIFVEKGCLRMFYINEKGTEQITQFAIENWWIADFMSYDRQQPSPYHIQSVEASDIWTIEHEMQDALVKELPQMERYFRLILQKAYAAAQMRVKYFREMNREEAYRQFSSDFPDFVQRVPQYMLASYLGLTPEYLSELRKKR
jgi:CRP/FNR family transcriptional regulator, anaerobic regulatory protein